MPAPRKPLTVAIEDTFNFWRQESNAAISLLNYFVTSGGLFTADNPQLTNVNINNGLIQNVTISDSVLEPTVSGYLTINNGTVNDSTIQTSLIQNSDITNSVVYDIIPSGTWDFQIAELNIQNGTTSERFNKGVGSGNAELYWDRTLQELRLFDGTTNGGTLAAYAGMTVADIETYKNEVIIPESLALAIALG